MRFCKQRFKMMIIPVSSKIKKKEKKELVRYNLIFSTRISRGQK